MSGAGTGTTGTTAGARRGRWVMLLLLLALATWVVAAPTWVSATGSSVLTTTVQVRVPGTRAAPGMVGAALALAAAGLALALAGRVGRWVVVVVVVACGALIGWSAGTVLADPGPAARQAVAVATGIDQVVGPTRTSPGPWAAIVVAVLVVGSGARLGRASARWAGPSRRHEPAQRAGSGAGEREAIGAARPRPAGPEPLVAEATSSGTGLAEHPDERAAWDALSRGEDPS